MAPNQVSILLIAPQDTAAHVTGALAASGWSITVATELTGEWQKIQDYAVIIMDAKGWREQVADWPLPANQPRKPLIVLGVADEHDGVQTNAQDTLLVTLPPDPGGLFRAALPPLVTHLVGHWQALARQQSMAIDLRRAKAQHQTLLEASRQQQAEDLAVLHAVATVCAQASNEDGMIEQVTRIIGDNFYPDNFGFLLLDENAGILHTHPSYRPQQPPKVTIPLGQGVTGTVALIGKSIRLDNVSHFSRYICGDIHTRAEVCVPMKIGQRILGVINAESTTLSAFTAADERLLLTLASQLAIAIERLRRETSERYQAQQLATIYEVGKQVSSILDVDKLLGEVVRLLAERMSFYNAAIALIEGEYLVFRAGYGGYADGGSFISDANPLLERNVYWQTLQEGRTVLIQDVGTLPDFQPNYRLPHIQALLSVPLQVNGEIIGLLTVSSDRPNNITPSDAALLEILADQVGSAMQNAHLYQETQRQMGELAGLYETALATGGALTQEALFQRLYQQVKQLLRPDIFLAVIYFESSQELEIVMAIEEDATIEEWVGWRLPLSAGGLTGWVMQHQHPLLITDMESEPLPREPHRIRQPVRTWLGVPLMVRDWLIGAFSLQSFQSHAFTLADQRFVESVAGQVAVALQNARLFEETNLRARQLAILNNLARETSSLLQIDEIAALVAHRLVNAFGYQTVAVYTLDIDRAELWLRGIAGIHPPHLQPITYRHPLAASDSDHADNLSRVIHSAEPIRAGGTAPADNGGGTELVLPLKSGAHIIGVLMIDDWQPSAFDDSELALLTTVADQLAIAIEKARLFKETQRRANELEVLTQISTTLRTARTIDEILPVIVSRTISLINGSQSAIFLLEPETGDMILRARSPHQYFHPGQRQSIAEGITGYVARTGIMHISASLQDDPLLNMIAEDERVLRNVVTAIALPLRAETEIIGVLHLGFRVEHTFSDEELRILTAIAEMAGSAIYRASVMETLEHHVTLRTQELAQANERLQEMDRLKSKFVADISHELRTPIANLLLYLDLMEKGMIEKRARYLSILREETKRLTKIIDPILNFSQLNLDRDKLAMLPLDLNPIVQQVVDRYQTTAQKNGIVLRFDAGRGLPQVNGDADRLISVVTNLVANAVNYTLRGEIRAITFADADGQMVCLQVQDEGIGISPADRPHLFDQFYRGEQASQSNIPGIGLGLTIVHEVIQQHGGYVEVQSEVDEGSVFQIWLPAYRQTKKMPA